MTTQKININQRQYLELEKLGLGVFAPLAGFMTQKEFNSVVDTMRLPSGEVVSIPVVLDIPKDAWENIRLAETLSLVYDNETVGEMDVTSRYSCDKSAVAAKVYGTVDRAHAGVNHFFMMGDGFLGGPVRLTKRVRFDFSEFELTPEQTKAHFRQKGWKTIAGFQTRNVPHRAHEYLLRLSLEYCDGLFVQPLVGTKKEGDYTPEAILAGYKTLVRDFLPGDKILVGVLSTAMRYAGPREALFHAMIRRNYGCTHFVVGRDHAGVGKFYRTYEAQHLAQQYEGDLGVKILPFCGPYYCDICGMIVTERICSHGKTHPQSVCEISGTLVRRALSDGGVCDPRVMRPEIVDAIRHVPKFIDELAS